MDLREWKLKVRSLQNKPRVAAVVELRRCEMGSCKLEKEKQMSKTVGNRLLRSLRMMVNKTAL